MSSADRDGINPAFHEQSGYDTSDDRYPPDWDARKEAIKQRDSYTCQDCGIEAGEGKQLHVHHITHLSDGGPNYLSNLELLCVDCHNDRHEHDITEGLDDYHPAPRQSSRFRQLVRTLLGGIVVLLIHGAAIAILLTPSVGDVLFFAGVVYFLALICGVELRPGTTGALYGCAGIVGLAFIQLVPLSVSDSAPVHPRFIVLTAFVPALLAGIRWRSQR